MQLQVRSSGYTGDRRGFAFKLIPNFSHCPSLIFFTTALYVRRKSDRSEDVQDVLYFILKGTKSCNYFTMIKH